MCLLIVVLADMGDNIAYRHGLEKDEDYWDIKAHKGGKGSVVVGNVTDVEIKISGARSAVPYYDTILRTGAWGKDLVVPTAMAAAATARIAAAPVAAMEA
jgi:hypothetical protein